LAELIGPLKNFEKKPRSEKAFGMDIALPYLLINLKWIFNNDNIVWPNIGSNRTLK
jgi:hypothetical protein